MSQRDIFSAALQIPDPAQRAAYLEQACGGDAELRRRVDALLRAHGSAGDFLARPAVEQVAGQLSLPGGSDQGVSRADPPSAGGHGGGPHGGDEHEGLGFLRPSGRPGSLGRLGHYEALEVLGRGGFGIVVRAFDEMLQRVVAIKVMAPELAATSPPRKRFLREARAAAGIRHENVIGIHAVEEQPIPYLVMEYVAGETLQQMLDRTGPLDVPEVLRIGRQIASGLAAAHARGLIHRDVKPANILLEQGAEPRVKISDFGLARAVDDASLTQSGVLAGTPMYMAPEQVQGEAIDQRADLFSLGSVLYVMCSGRPPFRAATTLAVLRRVAEDSPRPIREVIPEVPEWLCALIARLHAKNPAGRFQTAAEVADLLGRHLAHLEQPALAGRPAAVAFPKPRRPRRAPLLAGAALVLLIVGALLTSPLWRPGGRQSASPGPGGPTLPDPLELAKRPAAADALKREDIPAGWWKLAGFGAPEKAPAEVVAVLGARFRIPEVGRTSHHPDVSSELAVSPDGKRLAIGKGNEVVVFDTATGAVRRTLSGHKGRGRVYAAAFSPGGQFLAATTWGEGCAACVWDLSTGKLTLKLEGHTDAKVSGVAFSPNGAQLATSSWDRTVRLWEVATGKEQHVLETDAVRGYLAYSPNGRLIAAAGADGVVWVWDAGEGKEVVRLRGHWGLGGLAFSPDGKLLAVGTDRMLKVWDTATWEPTRELEACAAWLAFTPDGQTLLAGRGNCREGQEQEVTQWEVKTGKQQARLPLLARGGAATYALSPDGKTLYCTTQASDQWGNTGCERLVRVYDAGTGKPTGGHTGPVFAVAVSPDGRELASAGADRTVRLWDLATGKLAHALAQPGNAACTVAFSPDGKALAAGWKDGTMALYDVATGEERAALGPQGDKLSHLAFSPDGSLLASAGPGGLVKLWGLPGGHLRSLLQHAEMEVLTCVAFSPDGDTLVSGGEHKFVRLWDVKTGWGVGSLSARVGPVRWLGFHPDGGSLAVLGSGPPPCLAVWDLATRTEKQRVAVGGGGRAGEPQSAVASGAWRADGRLLATAGESDGTVRLWDLSPSHPRCRVIRVLPPGKQPLSCVAFTPEGRHLATANPDGTISVLRLAKRGEVYQVPAGPAK
jgi:WD40 repeat protein